MVSFRKWFPVLAVLVLLVAFTTQASAQQFNCQANAGVPTTVRSEGLSELVGDVLLNCTGSSSVASFNATIQIFLNTNITSKLNSAVTGQTEAALIVTPPGAGPNTALLATRVSDNSVAWLNVPITPAPAGSTGVFVMRITNVRANASQAGLSATPIPTPITMFISATGTQSVPINNPQQTVAFVQKGLGSVGLTSCSGGTSFSTSFQQCVGQSTGLPGSAGTINYNVQFSEGFPSAFKVVAAAGQTTAPAGTVFNGSESGYITTIGGFQIGTATNGTRLIARFANIPAGVAIYVTLDDTRTGSAVTPPTVLTNGTDGTIAAQLVSVTDATGSSISSISTTSTASCGSTSYAVVPVTLTGGAGAATWEILAEDPFAIEKISFGVVVAYTASPATNSPALTTATNPGTVTGALAPISTIGVMSSSAPIPRFADAPQPTPPATAVSISACVTNLLFPFVTNQLGFDTGIALANTSSDPFKNPKQNGACTLNFFGATTGGGAAPAAVTTPTINAGTVFAFTLGMGGTGFPAPAATFQGYMIAQCAFQYAHGFAFVTNGTMTQGYLGLILPSDNSSPTRGTPEALNN